MFVLDSHCDTPSQILRLRDIRIDNRYSHVDIPKLQRGGVDGVFFALYVPASMDSDAAVAKAYAYRLLDGVRSSLTEVDSAVLTTDPDEAYINKSNGKISVFLGLENGAAIGSSLKELKAFYDVGVRYMTLCHTGNNLICDSCATSTKRWNGLSPFGREVIAEMNRIGMLVDVSHISDDAFYDVIECSEKPVVATHSCCRALADHPRNLTDDMIRRIAEKGGVIQVNFYPLFLDSDFCTLFNSSELALKAEIEDEFIADPADPIKRAAWNEVQDEMIAIERPSFKRIADHIDHIVSLVGIEYVGLGSDFDGIALPPQGMEDISRLPLLFDELRRRGYSENDLKKIASENFFRVMKACQ